MSGTNKAPLGRSPEAESARRESREAARRAVFTVRYACTVAVVGVDGAFTRFDVSSLGSEVAARAVSIGQRVEDGELYVFDVTGDRATHDHVVTVLESDAAVVSWRDRVVS